MKLIQTNQYKQLQMIDEFERASFLSVKRNGLSLSLSLSSHCVCARTRQLREPLIR